MRWGFLPQEALQDLALLTTTINDVEDLLASFPAMRDLQARALTKKTWRQLFRHDLGGLGQDSA